MYMKSQKHGKGTTTRKSADRTDGASYNAPTQNGPNKETLEFHPGLRKQHNDLKFALTIPVGPILGKPLGLGTRVGQNGISVVGS